MHLVIPYPVSGENNAIPLGGKASFRHISCVSYCIQRLFDSMKIQLFIYSLSCNFSYAYDEKLECQYHSD